MGFEKKFEKTTSQSKGSLFLTTLSLDALQKGRVQLARLMFDLRKGVSAHEDVNICGKAGLTALDAAPLPVNDLLHSIRQIILPRLGDIIRIL
jgi:hypothetical protein